MPSYMTVSQGMADIVDGFYPFPSVCFLILPRKISLLSFVALLGSSGTVVAKSLMAVFRHCRDFCKGGYIEIFSCVQLESSETSRIILHD